MARFTIALLSGFLLLAPGTVRAADGPPAGTWKFTFPIPTGRESTAPLTFLVMLSESDKGWVGDIIGTSLQLTKEPKFESLTAKDDQVTFIIKIGDTPISFDGRVSKDGKKIRGSLVFVGKTFLVDLLPSKLKNLKDKFATALETLEQEPAGSEYFDAVFEVLARSTSKKLKADEVRAIVDKAAKQSENYGPRWQRAVSMRMASTLGDQDAFASIALEQARQAERMLKPDDTAAIQMEVLEALAQTLRKAKKLDELKPVEARMAKLEARDFVDYVKKMSTFKPEEFKGRKSKSDRAVLVELFTGAECPPCVAVDLAFDALQATYKPTEVVGLEYHLHVPAPDPLTNGDGMQRVTYYKGKIEGTPTIFFNGKRDEGGGGGKAAAKSKYTSFCETIDEWLEKPAGAKLQLSATQKGGEISAKAVVSDLAKPGEKIMLRFALAEERVRYQGGNGIRYHHCVVRALPGGAKGVALTKAQSEHMAEVNLDKLRTEINGYLDEAAKEDEFPNNDRPLALRNLRVVAFIQDDATSEVIQAAQVEVEEKKGE